MIPDALEALLSFARPSEPNLFAVHLLAWGRIGRVRNSFGARSFGAKSLGAKSLGAKSLGAKSLGAKSLGAKSLGAKSLGAKWP
jgi:hypothetical protein